MAHVGELEADGHQGHRPGAAPARVGQGDRPVAATPRTGTVSTIKKIASRR